MQNPSPLGWAFRPLKRYAEFSGRSSRAEFWWFFLGLFVLYMVMWFAFFGAIFSSIAAAQGNPGAGMAGAIGIGAILIGLFWLALIIPSIAVQVRRLHDTNRSGWWLGGFYLLYVGYFVLIFGMMGALMATAASGNGTPPTLPGSGMFTGIMVFGLVMFVYMIALLVFYCLPGTRGPNRFGDDPYGANVEEVFA
jgi:uncharacterized membrane protein YhaH (DUF805 family)